jgi:hypothetical protein
MLLCGVQCCIEVGIGTLQQVPFLDQEIEELRDDVDHSKGAKYKMTQGLRDGQVVARSPTWNMSGW